MARGRAGGVGARPYPPRRAGRHASAATARAPGHGGATRAREQVGGTSLAGPGRPL